MFAFAQLFFYDFHDDFLALCKLVGLLGRLNRFCTLLESRLVGRDLILNLLFLSGVVNFLNLSLKLADSRFCLLFVVEEGRWTASSFPFLLLDVVLALGL